MGLYNTPFGQSEVGGHSRTNAMGQTVYTSGNVYDGYGNIISMSPINSQTLPGWYTSSKNQGSSKTGSGITGGLIMNPSAEKTANNHLSDWWDGWGVNKYGQDMGPLERAELINKNAIDTMREGVLAAQKTGANVQGHITNVSKDLDRARSSALGIGTAITNLNNTAASLNPFIKSLTDQGNLSLSLYDQLMSGNTISGSAADKYLGAIGLAADAAKNITPDRYVSMAASDVQKSFDNAQEQMARNAGRMGVSEGSGNTAALRQQAAQALATALAAAKTKARQQGVSDQLNALTQTSSLYKDVLSTAQSAQQQGTQTLAQAAGVVQAQGDIFATSGNLSNTQVNAFATIGGVEVNLGQLELQNNEAVQSALQGVAAAQQALGNFYKDIDEMTSDGKRHKYSGYWAV